MEDDAALNGEQVAHGTFTAYIKDRCRCDICRPWWNAYVAYRRAVQLGRRHGKCPTCTCQMPEKPTPGVRPAEAQEASSRTGGEG